MRHIYMFLAVVMLFGAASCKKASKSDSTGNVTGNGTGTDVPSNATDGVTFINNGTSVIFNLYAPKKTSVSVIGDFNNWQPTAMKQSTDGTRWWVQVDNIDPNTEYAYQYLIDGSLRVADPYTEKVLDPANDQYIPSSVYPNLKAYPTGKTTGIVSTFEANQPAYTWKVTNFTRPAPKNLVVYELLVRDFVATHSYKTLTDTLNYIANLGCNAIELLPVNEFEGNDSWGYNTNFGMALDKYYGTKNDYKAFIDACHAKGIAVIQDIVGEDQFGSSPMVQMYATSSGAPSSDNPWFDTQNMHPDAVGYQMNHQSAATQYYFKNMVKYWMKEYHIDGFRFDQAKGYTQTASSTESAWAQYDASRVALWKTYNSYIQSLDPTFYVILEYFAVNQEEAELATAGMMTWTNLNSPAAQTTMSYPNNPSWDLSGLFYDQYGFTNPYGLMTYFESHDEERTMYDNETYGNASGSYSTKDIPTALKREEAAATLLFGSPGPKMIWQFEERGYDISINTNGRLGDKDPHWEYMNDANRHHLYATYAKLIHWKTNNDVFTTTNFKYNLGTYVKFIQLVGTSNSVEIIGNFDVNTQVGSITFPQQGTWYDNITGTTINVNSTPFNITLAPGEYHVYSLTALK